MFHCSLVSLRDGYNIDSAIWGAAVCVHARRNTRKSQYSCFSLHFSASSTQLAFFVFFLFVFKAQVLYDFTAEPGNNELTVKEGETVTITNQVSLYCSLRFMCCSVSHI